MNSSVVSRLSIVLVSALMGQASAQWDFDNSGGRIFDMRDNTKKSVKITLESVDPKQIKSACDRKSKELGFGGLPHPALACAFWRGNNCHIIVPHKVDMRTIGHEVMHCFQGNWH